MGTSNTRKAARRMTIAHVCSVRADRKSNSAQFYAATYAPRRLGDPLWDGIPLQGLADVETDPAKLAAMAEPELQAGLQRLADTLSAAATLSPLYRQILWLFLQRLE